ncbi:MAG: GMC oxidoreductase, partial [Gordonia sp. (in: high G+C Gram-positive bacteria)]|uniref:GMC oxidoreductase n=1 Tax=Gordonia sp. (in: high G+C Gram-positive bacteria) TaxID=84139 RepID=UPI003BB6421E
LGHPTVGVLDETGLDLGAPDAESLARMDRGAAQVVAMLGSSSFAGLVESGSIAVDPVMSMSQHATGTLPLGTVVDQWGEVPGIGGLRVVDGSILPGSTHAGPHATIAMVAWVIGGAI